MWAEDELGLGAGLSGMTRSETVQLWLESVTGCQKSVSPKYHCFRHCLYFCPIVGVVRSFLLDIIPREISDVEGDSINRKLADWNVYGVLLTVK